MPLAEAVTEAARRLGDPRQLAREHARVRSPFGQPLSTGRALTAAVIFAMPLIAWTLNLDALRGVSLRVWFELGAFVIIAIALAARMTWARAVVLGVTVQVLTLSFVTPAPVHPLHLIWELGVLALVMPWDHKEVSPAAISLALQVWVYGSASSMLSFLFIAPDGALPLGSACGTIALVCSAAGCIGSVLRSRWSAIASVVSALALFSVLGELSVSWINTRDAAQWELYIFGAAGSGAIAAIIAAVLSWRTTRSLAGTLQHVMR